MGTPLPETSPPGDFANFCWLTDAYLNPDDPPKFLTIEISGMLKGDLWTPLEPEPPNGQFVLTQANTIEWNLTRDDIVVAIAWSSIESHFRILFIPPVAVLPFEAFGSTCQTSLPNTFDSAAGKHFYSGVIKTLGIS